MSGHNGLESFLKEILIFMDQRFHEFFFIVNFLGWLFLMAKFPKLNLIYMTFSDQTMF